MSGLSRAPFSSAAPGLGRAPAHAGPLGALGDQLLAATLHRPRLLVLDEPTASLDPEVAMRVRQGLLDLARTEGSTLLITSHDMSEVEKLCERVVFVSRGRVVADGSPSEVTASFGRSGLEDVFLHLAARQPLGADGAGADPMDRR
jgi:ABC-2 type transport system ATP-binding protein